MTVFVSRIELEEGLFGNLLYVVGALVLGYFSYSNIKEAFYKGNYLSLSYEGIFIDGLMLEWHLIAYCHFYISKSEHSTTRYLRICLLEDELNLDYDIDVLPMSMPKLGKLVYGYMKTFCPR